MVHKLGWKRPEKLDDRDVLMRHVYEYENTLGSLTYRLDASIQQAIDEKWFKSLNATYKFYRWAKKQVKTPPVPPTPSVDSILWNNLINLDQGATPHCVGFASTHFLDADPVPQSLLDEYAHALYYECKEVDYEPLQEDGTYVQTAMKVLQNRGRINTYVSARSVSELKTWVLTKSPVVVGTDFYWEMETPNKDGFVYPTGGVAGGHAYLMCGYDKKTDAFTFQNSWGTDWGLGGYFKMYAKDWEVLFSNNGEAFTTVELPLAALRAIKARD